MAKTLADLAGADSKDVKVDVTIPQADQPQVFACLCAPRCSAHLFRIAVAGHAAFASAEEGEGQCALTLTNVLVQQPSGYYSLSTRKRCQLCRGECGIYD